MAVERHIARVLPDLRDELEHALGPDYTVDRELGGGGMSRVFVARDTRLKRVVVVKVMALDAGLDTARFEREIQLAATLQQANIVPLLTAGEVGRVPFYTMPYIDGESLREMLRRRGPLPIAETVGILRDIARALSYAHSRGVVHRDIKPDNILLSHGTAMVADFGIAKAVSDAVDGRSGASGTTLTGVGVLVGTPAYMSPEQALGEGLDHRSDIYAVGCVAFELLTGHPPFEGLASPRLLAAHATQAPADIATLRPEIPPALAALVMRCLEKSPEARPATAADVLKALDSFSPTNAPARVLPSWSRVAVAAVVVMIAVAGIVALRRGVRTQAIQSIAVVPFANLGGAGADAYFGDGLAEELTTALGQAGLPVVGRATARALAARGVDAIAIAKQLGASGVLHGSVQRDGERVRITVVLTAAATGREIWERRYDRRLADVFAVQDDIARNVAEQLRATLNSTRPQLVRAETGDPEAHTLYLKGLYQWNRRTGPAVQQAIGLFDEATRRDPRYARAHAGLALAYAVLPVFMDVPVDATMDKAMEAAQRALAIDSSLAEAHAAIGFVKTFRFENAAAEQAFQRAFALDSTLAVTHYWYSFLLSHIGRVDDALRAVRRAQALEPVSLIFQIGATQQLIGARRYAEADSSLRAVNAVDSTSTLSLILRGELRIEQGRFDEAVAAMERVGAATDLRTTYRLGFLAWAYARAGRAEAARRTLRRLPVDTLLSVSGNVAAALAALGDQDKAVDMFRRAVAQHDQWIALQSRGALYDALRRDPRTGLLLTRIESAAATRP